MSGRAHLDPSDFASARSRQPEASIAKSGSWRPACSADARSHETRVARRGIESGRSAGQDYRRGRSHDESHRMDMASVYTASAERVAGTGPPHHSESLSLASVRES